MINLDVKDKKLLTALDENARYSNTQLAKKVGLSKPAVEYRIKRFQKNKIIFAYYTVIDVTKLGYSHFKIYFKFQNASPKNEEQISNHWIKNSNTVWVAQSRGHWDLAVSILAKNNHEFGKILSEFMTKFSQYILQKDVLLTEYSPIYAREYLEKTQPKEFFFGIPTEIYKLNDADKKILKEIANNARITILELAKKTKLSRDIITYRLKKLTKDRIIVQYRTFLNLENLNIKHYKIIIRTKNLSPEKENQLKEYVAQHKKIGQFLKLIGSYDLEIEFEADDEDELYKSINEIRQKFSDIIRDYDILRITKTHKYNYFPFEI